MVAQNDGNAALSVTIPVTATDPAGEDSSNHPTAKVSIHWPPKQCFGPIMGTFPLFPGAVSCAGAYTYIHCLNGTSDGFCSVGGVPGGNCTAVNSFFYSRVVFATLQPTTLHKI